MTAGLALLAATLGLIAHGLAEPLMRQRTAGDLSATPFDRGSTTLVTVLALIALVSAVCTRLAGSRLDGVSMSVMFWALVPVLFLGVGLRYWSMATLGRYFTRRLRVADGQRLVRSGPYRCIRHPGYAANLLAYASACALISASWLVGAAVLVLLGLAYAYRIHQEERMLRATLGEPYRQYQRRTYRLVPWLY